MRVSVKLLEINLALLVPKANYSLEGVINWNPMTNDAIVQTKITRIYLDFKTVTPRT